MPENLAASIEALFSLIVGDISTTTDPTLRAVVVASYTRWWAGQLEGRLGIAVAPLPGPEVQYLTSREIAALLGLHEQTVREMIRTGALSPVSYPLPGSPRMERSDLQRWMKARERHGAQDGGLAAGPAGPVGLQTRRRRS